MTLPSQSGGKNENMLSSDASVTPQASGDAFSACIVHQKVNTPAQVNRKSWSGHALIIHEGCYGALFLLASKFKAFRGAKRGPIRYVETMETRTGVI